MFVHNFSQHLYASLKSYLFATNFTIEVFSSTAPVDLDAYEAALLADSTAYDSVRLLEYTGLTITDQNSHLYIKPYGADGIIDGSASWMVVHSVAGPGTYKLMGDVSVAGGTGLLQLDDIAVVTGEQTMLIDFTIDTEELA